MHVIYNICNFNVNVILYTTFQIIIIIQIINMLILFNNYVLEFNEYSTEW